MDVRLTGASARFSKIDALELDRYVDQFFEMRAGRTFNWDAMPVRWQNAMSLLSRLWFEWTEHREKAVARATIYTAAVWGYRP